jgi:hypothetical protein
MILSLEFTFVSFSYQCSKDITIHVIKDFNKCAVSFRITFQYNEII